MPLPIRMASAPGRGLAYPESIRQTPTPSRALSRRRISAGHAPHALHGGLHGAIIESPLLQRMEPMPLSRRRLLRTGMISGLTVAGGLGLAYTSRWLDDGDAVEKFGATTGDTTALNAWLKIGPDGRIVCGVHRAEMGQGVSTSLPMLLAEELDADWSQVTYEFTPVDKDYFNFGILLRGQPLGPVEDRFLAGLGTGLIREVFHQLGLCLTISSSSIIDGWDTLRQAGAEARGLLVAAAAQRWSVPSTRLVTANSRVRDPQTGQSASYGELVAQAARLRPTGRPVLKAPKDFRLLGRSLSRLDVPAKVTGTARFAIDTQLPGMLFGAVRHGPVAGAPIDRVDPGGALALRGVERVVRLGDRGVAVLARDTWTAQQAARLLVISANPGFPGPPDSPALAASYRAALDAEGPSAPPRSVFRDDEGVDAYLGAAPITATYQLPFLAHVCLEPMNCTALFATGRLTLWAPTQAPSLARDEAARVAGLPRERVTVITTLMGGGFGRRVEMDFILEATYAALAVPGRPVKLTWSREEDVRHDMYRPAAAGRVRGTLGADGRLAALDYALVSESVVASNFRRTPTPRGGDPAKDQSALGGALNACYPFPRMRMAYLPRNDGVPTGFWRSVSNSINPFLLESFMDELAFSAGVDPVALRLTHLEGLTEAQTVLRAAATLGRWGQPLPQGTGRRWGRGVAFLDCHDSLVATVVEVSVGDGGDLRVVRVACVVDCRTVIHPDGAEAQITGGILDGLNGALKSQITFRNGAVEQSNFHDYPWLRLGEVPDITVQLLPQGGRPGGVGEPGVPGVAPALANAIFAATGYRPRSLPVLTAEFSQQVRR